MITEKINKRKKLHLVGPYYSNISLYTVRRTSKVSKNNVHFLSNLAEVQQIPMGRYPGWGRGNWKDPSSVIVL